MQYVHEDFDGAQPRTGSRQVVLNDSDTELMWDLFDYTKVSSCQRHSDGLDMDGCKDVQPAFPGVCPGCRGNSRAAPPETEALSNPSMLHNGLLGTNEVNASNMQWDNMIEGLEDCTNDWSLLGTPWLDYFPA